MSLDVKRNFWSMWIKVPCIQNVGSCYYSDLCKYAPTENDICPYVLSENDIPCRCPISAVSI